MRILGWGLILAGGLGLFTRVTYAQAVTAYQTGTTSTEVPNVPNFDPASMFFGQAPSGQLLDVGTLIDAGIVWGGWMLVRRR
jgi:hypothetical protein